MIDATTYLMYIAASVAIIIVPGPTVTVIIANSLRAGTSAGLMNVAGTQAGLALMIVVLAVGLTTIVASMGVFFDVVRLCGAAYLVWLGIKLWRSDGSLGDVPKNGKKTKAASEYFWQGVLVIWSNPKALFFFGAFIPQFIDPTGDPLPQILLLGVTFMALATVLDGTYAVAAGKTGALLSRGNIRLLERVSGTCLIGGGIWLALERRAFG